MKRLALLALFSLAACDAAIVAPTISLLEIEPIVDVLFPGDTTRLTAIVKNEHGEYLVSPAITWESTDTTVIRVTSNGHAIAVRPGTANIRMRYGASEATHGMRVDSGFVFIEAGPAATCGFMHDGDLYCWGERRSIGDAGLTSAPILLPRRVPTDLRFKQFSIGSNHTCAVTFDQRAYCWGTGRKGETGDGNVYHNSDVPLPVAGDLRFKDVSAGWEHSCGLTPEGVAYCWGRGYEGQLGIGEFGFRSTPAVVQTTLRFKQLQAAGSNTCGITFEGHAYCWGMKDYLGDPSITQHQPLPVRVPVPVIDVFDSANDDPCGITPDKQMFCWTNTVQPVPAVGSVQAVTVGGGHICAQQLNGRVLCYGKNNVGQLGNGTTVDSPEPIEPAGSLKFVQFAAGAFHTCGITDTGAAYCWGYNNHGQLGDATRGNSNKPIRVLIPRD